MSFILNSLQDLLQPLTLTEFFSQYWTKKAVIVPNSKLAGSDHCLTELFTWSQLNHLLNFHRLRCPDDVRFAKDCQTLSTPSPKDWVKQLQQGATLILNHVHVLDPKLAALAASIRYELGHPVQINAYCTPGEEQGFDCHYDTHEVFILQIAGEKEWFIFPETIPYPLSETRSHQDLPPEGLPYLKTVLKPGDLLYIPRGHWHYAVPYRATAVAVAGDYPQFDPVLNPSLHLTIGVSSYTGLDWLDWLRQQLQEDQRWRENLPTFCDGSPQAIQQHLFALGEYLAIESQNPRMVEDYIKTLFTRERAVDPIALPQQLGYQLFKDGFETKFRRSIVQHYHLELLTDSTLRVTVGTKQLDLQIKNPDNNPESNPDNNFKVVTWIFQQSQFSLMDLAEIAPDLDWERQLAPLLTKLVAEGILFVVNEI